MSEFINRSKDAWGTAEVESHFGSDNTPYASGQGSWKTRPPGGTAAWNTANPSTASEDGLQNRQPTGAPTDNSLFNAGSQKLPRESGVNYTPAKQAGHKLTEDPFQLADGFPGN